MSQDLGWIHVIDNQYCKPKIDYEWADVAELELQRDDLLKRAEAIHIIDESKYSDDMLDIARETNARRYVDKSILTDQAKQIQITIDDILKNQDS